MVLSAHMHSPTSWAEPNAIYSMNMCTATHVWLQVTLGNACACPGRFISPAHRPFLEVYYWNMPGVARSKAIPTCCFPFTLIYLSPISSCLFLHSTPIFIPYILATVTMRLPSVVITYQLRVSHPLYHFTLFLSYLLLSHCSYIFTTGV